MPEAPTSISRPPPRPPRRRLASMGSLALGLGLIGVITLTIAAQVSSRTEFANTSLADDVESRWGAPVDQAAPSLRAVPSGTVFTELTPLPLASQTVVVDAAMNYRKRGLVYFSGFDFTFEGRFTATNPERHDVDVAFVFPLEVDKSRVLLSELRFEVDGRPASLDLGPAGDRLVWTGRLAVGQSAEFHIHYRARGLDAFVYHLDPSLPAHAVSVELRVKGGDNIDYPPAVLAASEVHREGDAVRLAWRFTSLESGVALGALLPSLKQYDSLMSRMAARATVPGLAFLLGLVLLAARYRRRLAVWELALAAAAFGFTHVLLAYLGAQVHFLVAWAFTMAFMGAATVRFVARLFPGARLRLLIGGWAATQVVPTLAVLVPTYTGLIYTVELLALLLGAMALGTRAEVRALLSDAPRAGEVTP